ncbi:MAG TPA: hypothetical protein VNA12_07030 [Mycobacteriales bacterium]|nr:hypothetical protein [Mycobacteriales bacterium]
MTPRSDRGDRGDIVVGWLTKILLVLVVVAVVLFEAVSIGLAHVGTQDLAQQAARAGSAEFARTKDVQRAYHSAAAIAAEKEGTIEPEEFLVEPDGSVELTVHREATSVLLYRLSATRGWLKVDETARARFVG